jgi:hypothetical protein
MGVGEMAVASATTASRWRQRLAVVLVLIAAMWPTGELAAEDAASRTLAIFAVHCPAGFADDASVDECDEIRVRDVTFRVGRPYTVLVITGRTDSDGIVACDITGLPYRGMIRFIEELPFGTARVGASCVDEAEIPLPITDEPFPENDPPISAALVAARESGDVRCDWYNIPVS